MYKESKITDTFFFSGKLLYHELNNFLFWNSNFGFKFKCEKGFFFLKKCVYHKFLRKNLVFDKHKDLHKYKSQGITNSYGITINCEDSTSLGDPYNVRDVIYNSISVYMFVHFFEELFRKKYIFFRLKGRGYRLYRDLNFITMKLGLSHLCYYLIPFEFLLHSDRKFQYSKVIGTSFYAVCMLTKQLQSFRLPRSYVKKGIFSSVT
jgi:hypothetical protein